MRKKLTAITAAVIIILSLIPISAFAAQNTLPEDAVIVTAENCPATDTSAAEILQKYIERIDGIRHEIKTSAQGKYAITVGEAAASHEDAALLPDGSYIIKSSADAVEITGNGNRGTIYGAYAFLEKFCGYNCFTASMGMVSNFTEIVIPDNTDIKYTAYFEYTDTDWKSPRDVEYSLANGLSGGVYRDIPSELGGTVSYIGPFCHTLTSVFCSGEEYFTEHPEYFALHNGKRTPDQLCLTNEDTYNIVLNEVTELLQTEHDPDAAVQIISLTQADNQNYCECESCKAVDDANGSHAGTMITFANRIAKAVKAAGYDNIAIDTFAYQYTRKTPAEVVPEDNVIVRLCTIECCFSHPLDDANCEENVALMQDLMNWNKICDRLYIWDYTTNYKNTLGIFPDFGVISKNIQIFYDYGVKGIYEEGNYYIYNCDTEFGELRAYMLAKLMQDPYCDEDELMNKFTEGYYGEGGKYIKEFIDMTSENAAKGHVKIYSEMSKSLFFTNEEIQTCDELWEKAKAECTDETQLENIKRSEISWRYWKASSNKGEFKGLISSTGAKKELMEDILASGAKQSTEGGSEIKPVALYMFAPASEWFGTASVADSPILLCAWVIYAAALVCALIIFIKAIKLKRPLYCAIFPVLAASAELAMWNRRAYLAWKDIGEYALTVVIFCLVFALLGIASANAKAKNRKNIIKGAVIGAVSFAAVYFGLSFAINILIYHGNANRIAIAITLAAIAAASLVFTAKTAKQLKTEDK